MTTESVPVVAPSGTVALMRYPSHLKLRWHAVEGDAGRPSQVIAKDEDAVPNFGCQRYGLHQRVEIKGETEGFSVTQRRATTCSRAIKNPVRCLELSGQFVRGELVEGVYTP